MIKLDNFSVSKYPVTKAEWDAVRLWGKENGYTDLSVGRGTGRQPVGCITWYDAIKFLNAMSELAGFEPVYKVDGEVYRIGIADLDDFDKSANGYRLPLKDEWIYAARGGTTTKYLWGDEEYPGCFEYAQEFKDAKEITKEVGLKKPNGYGLYDVIGNVYEWCFDKKYDTLRVIMGGSVALDSILATEHESITSPEYKSYETGFRAFSSNMCALSIEEIAKKSEYYGKEEWPEPEYRDMSKVAIAKRLNAQLSDDEFSHTVKDLIDVGKIDEAFELFRNKKFRDIKERCKDLATSARFPKKNDELLKKKDVNDIIFFKGNFGYDVYHGFDEFVYIAERFKETKDKKYFDCCILILKAFLIRHKAEFDVLTDVELSERNNTPLTWAWGNGFDTTRRLVYIMNGLADISIAMEGDYEDFPADLFAELAVSLVTYGIYPGIKDGREKITNQIAHSVNCITVVTGVFYELKNAALAEKISLERHKNGTQASIYPDGSACEQSIDYNYYTLYSFFCVEKNVRNAENLKEAKEVVSGLSQMTLSVKTPSLNDPMTAYTFSGAYNYPANKEDLKDFYELTAYINERRKNTDWCEWDRIKAGAKKEGADTPKFNSIFFPYGGTAAIRDGWGRDARYIYFFAPRAGAGHSAEAVCDIQLHAFGRELIKTGGVLSYGLKQRMLEEQIPMMNDLDKYMHRSNSRNTILVDGEGQSRMKHTEQVVVDKYPDTTGYRWHESDSLVYIEGKYSDGYYRSDDVIHKREILFFKEEGIWVVVDRLYSEKSHTYTQNWHLNVAGEIYERKIGEKVYSWEMDGFNRDDIVIGENEVYTKDKNGANIYIRHFGDMTYERFYGEKEPYRGWSSCIDNKFRYFPVEEIHCDFKGEKNTVLLTIIEASPSDESAIKNVLRKENGGSFEMNGKNYRFTQDKNGRIELSKNDVKWIVLDDLGNEFTEIKDGIKTEFKAPIDFKWVEKDGYFEPCYEY